jgi:hypothetical protein
MSTKKTSTGNDFGDIVKELENPEANLFDDETTKVKSNWFKFENVGDRVQGTVTDVFTKEGEGAYPAQRVFTLRQSNGDETNVGLRATNEYLMQRTKNVRKGDLVGFEFAKEVPASKPGYAPAKSIEPRVKYTKTGDAERSLEGLPSRAQA